MLSAQNSLVKQAKANENPQGFQNWNRQLAPTNEGIQSSMDDPVQLKSKEFQYNPNQKLMAIQKMANDSTNNKHIIQLKALANIYTQQKQLPLQLKKNNSGLPDTLKSGVESLSGLSMDDVKVHYNSDKPAQLNAHAYAQGTDIHLASGQEKHLAHEAWHVVQQKQGRVQPTMMMKAKVPINDDQGLEKEADIMGARALQMKPFSLSDYRTEKSVQRKGIIQKVDGEQSEALNEHLDLETPGEEEVEFNIMSTINTLYHTTTSAGADKSILQRIDPAFFKSSSRFGGGFYLTNDIATSEAEIAHHKLDDPDNPLNAYVTISYNISGGKILDATGPAIYKTVEENPIHLRRMAQRGGMDGIAIPSLRGSGTNVVLFKNFGILKEGKQIQHRLPDKDIKRLPDGQPDMKKNGEFKETL
jgi:hypothetical protein